MFQDDESVQVLADRLGMHPNEIWANAMELFQRNAEKYLSETDCDRATAARIGLASTYLAGLIEGMEITVQRN